MRQANALCASYTATVGKLATPATLADLPAFASGGAAALRAATVSLRQLPVAKADQTTVASWLGELDRQVVLADQLVKLAQAQDVAAVEAFVAANRGVDARANALARQLGALECAKEDSAG